MPELLKIAPRVPDISPGQINVPLGGGAYVGRGLQELGNVFQQIQMGEDAGDAMRISSSASAQMEKAVTEATDKYSDPEQFREAATTANDVIFKDALASAPNGRVRRAVQDRIANNQVLAQRAIEHNFFLKKKDKGIAGFQTSYDQAVNDFAKTSDPALHEAIQKSISYDLGQLHGSNFIDFEGARKVQQKFTKDAYTALAAAEMDADASAFLRKLNSPGSEYDVLSDADKRSLTRSANSILTSQLAIHEREQKIKREQADTEIQVLFDKGASEAVIAARLKELSLAGILTRTEREFWDNKLMKGTKNDTPEQTSNANVMKAEFQGQGYPTPGTVDAARKAADAAFHSGQIGILGWGNFKAYLNNIQHSLRSQQLGEEAAWRARQGFENRTASKETKMTSDQAKTLVGQNFPYDSVSKPANRDHQNDVKELSERSLVNKENTGDVAREIYDRRKKQIEADAKKRKDKIDAAQKDPKAKSMFDRLKELGGK